MRRAIFGACLCSQENVLWRSMGEPEFRVLLRIIVSLTSFSSLAKRIWMGFPFDGDFVLARAAELGLLLLIVLCHSYSLLGCDCPHLLEAQNKDCISKTFGRQTDLHFVLSCEVLYVAC